MSQLVIIFEQVSGSIQGNIRGLYGAAQGNVEKIFKPDGNCAILLSVPHFESLRETLYLYTQHDKVVHRYLAFFVASLREEAYELWREPESHLFQG